MTASRKLRSHRQAGNRLDTGHKAEENQQDETAPMVM